MTRPPTEAAPPNSILVLVLISTAVATHSPPLADNATTRSLPRRDLGHAPTAAPAVGVNTNSSWTDLDPRLGLSGAASN
jgi:hypothetical protein